MVIGQKSKRHLSHLSEIYAFIVAQNQKTTEHTAITKEPAQKILIESTSQPA